MISPPFAIFHDADAYSTDIKLMGRQVAGKTFLRGVARTWRDADIGVVGGSRQGALAVHEELSTAGFRGRVAFSQLPAWDTAQRAGCLYFPSPIPRVIAACRDALHPTAFSVMGVTHSLCTPSVMEHMSAMALAPFQPWDALICTSLAAQTVAATLLEETRDYWRRTTGATRFNQPALPVIPLGVHVDDMRPQAGGREKARAALGLETDEVAFLFAGRLAYHAKANPAPLYQALERLAATRRVVCIEAGIHASETMRDGLEASRRALAPSLRTIWVDGSDQGKNATARAAADVFVSLADNIQESFGLTPIEAMAAGLPVVVSDWDGYKDTVRHGVDGFRIPTVAPPAGAGQTLAQQHLLGLIPYDQFIGRASLATYVDAGTLYQALDQLAGDPGLRQRLGQAGQRRAQSEYDWPVILARYADLTVELAKLREQARRDGVASPGTPPGLGDPFQQFRQFPTATLQAEWRFRPTAGGRERLHMITELPIARFGFDQGSFPATLPGELLNALPDAGARTDDWLTAAGMRTEFGVRALMWLWKFGLITPVAEPSGTAAP